jgi:hypothetical protein
MKTSALIVMVMFFYCNTIICQKKITNKDNKKVTIESKDEVKKLNDTISTLRKEISTLNDSIKSLNNKLTESYQKLIKKYENEDSKNTNKTNTNYKTENYTAIIIEKDKLIAVLRDSLINAKEIISTIQYDIKSFESDLADYKKQIKIKELQTKILFKSFESELDNRVNQLATSEDFMNIKPLAENMIKQLNELKNEIEPKNTFEKSITTLNLIIKLADLRVKKDQFLNEEFNENTYTKLKLEIIQMQENEKTGMNSVQKGMLLDIQQLLIKYCAKYNEIVSIFEESDAFIPNISQAQEVLKNKWDDAELKQYTFLKKKLKDKYNNPKIEKSIKRVNCK